MLAELIYTHGTASFLMLLTNGSYVHPAKPYGFGGPQLWKGDDPGDAIQFHLYSLLLDETKPQ